MASFILLPRNLNSGGIRRGHRSGVGVWRKKRTSVNENQEDSLSSATSTGRLNSTSLLILTSLGHILSSDLIEPSLTFLHSPLSSPLSIKMFPHLSSHFLSLHDFPSPISAIYSYQCRISLFRLGFSVFQIVKLKSFRPSFKRFLLAIYQRQISFIGFLFLIGLTHYWNQPSNRLNSNSSKTLNSLTLFVNAYSQSSISPSLFGTTPVLGTFTTHIRQALKSTSIYFLYSKSIQST
jgi:hypothetical protein